MTCKTCKFAAWETTPSGRISKSIPVRCRAVVEIVAPACVSMHERRSAIWPEEYGDCSMYSLLQISPSHCLSGHCPALKIVDIYTHKYLAYCFCGYIIKSSDQQRKGNEMIRLEAKQIRQFERWMESIEAMFVATGMEQWQAGCKLEAYSLTRLQQKFLDGVSASDMLEILK